MTGATENFKHRGIIPRAITNIFREISNRVQLAVTVRVRYMEIYNESLSDLLSTLKKSDIQEDVPSTLREEQAGTLVRKRSHGIQGHQF